MDNNNEIIDQFLLNFETLQEQLMELDTDNIISTRENLLLLLLDNINEKVENYQNMFIKSLSLHLIIASKMRPTKIKMIVEVIISIFSDDQITNLKRCTFYKTIILTTIFNSIKTNLTLSSQCTIVCLLHHFVRLDFFQMKQILSLYKNEKVTRNKGKKAIFTIFFCWFAPEIELEDQPFYEITLNWFLEASRYIRCFPADLQYFSQNIKELKKSNWKKLRKMRENNASHCKMLEVLKDDDIEIFQMLQNEPDFDWEQKIEPSIYDWRSVCRKIIQIAYL